MIFQSKPVKKLASGKLDLLIIPIFENSTIKSLSKNPVFSEIEHHLKQKDFTDQASSSVLFYPKEDKIANRILLIKLDKTKSQSVSKIILNSIKPLSGKHANLGMLFVDTLDKQIVFDLTVGLYKQLFQFHSHKSTVADKDKHKLESLTFFTNRNIDKQIREAVSLGDSYWLISELAHRPANDLTPTKFGEVATEIAKEAGFSVNILGETEMRKLSMGGILGVSQGSDEEAKLIVCEYNKKAKYTVALVGKGITFDSGGISIKPAKDMHEMKFDMIGGATVLACIQAAAKLKLPIHIVGVIAASENLPSGKALKPGDVVKTFSGKTVEVLNTDAEGRLVLADAISYAQKKFKPKTIIDIATLTGAVVVALGGKITGAFGNNPKVNEKFSASAKQSKEDLHFLPLYTGYNDELKSSIADSANIGKQRVDALIGALFLNQFVDKNTSWIHLDIAGTAWTGDQPTGVMFLSVINFIKTLPKR